MPDARMVARALADAGAVQAADESAGAGPLDVAMLSTQPAQADVVRQQVVAWLLPYRSEIDLIISPNLASLPLVTMAAAALDLPMAYLRPKPKEHGRKRQVEGVLPPGGRALLLYGEIGAYTPVEDAREIVEAHGGTAALVAGLVGSGEATAGAPLCLTTHEEVRRQLTERGRAAVTPAPARLAAPSQERRAHTRERVAEILLTVGAVMVNAAQPFRYASGILSPIYTDNRLLISHPSEWREIVAGYADALALVVAQQPIDVLVGAATAGVPHGARLAEVTGFPMAFVDLSESSDGPAGRGYGLLRAGDHAAIVEDLVTTGKSVFESLAALRERGLLVDWCLAIFTYSPEAVGAVLKAEGLGFTALSDIATLLEVGVRDGHLTEADRTAVQEWLRDPKAWSAQAETRLATAASSS